MITNDFEKASILTAWSREVLLAEESSNDVFVCSCRDSVMITVGRKDRVRCKKCKTMFEVEI